MRCATERKALGSAVLSRKAADRRVVHRRSCKNRPGDLSLRPASSISILFLTVSDNVFALFSVFLQKATLIENFNVKINPHLQETHRKKQINLNFTDHTISHDVPFLSCWACLVQNMLCCVLGTFRGITPSGAVTPRDSLDGKVFIVIVERNNKPV